MLKYQQFIIESTPPNPNSRGQLRRKEWFERNKDLKAIPVEWKDLPQYGVPDGIIERMKDWTTILKSPYSNSFYSSVDVSFNFKPHDSLRVANHWNFISKRDNNLHCRTDIPIENDSVWGIGEFDSERKLYKITFTEKCPKWEKENQEKIQSKEQKLKYLKDPEVIWKKKQFKSAVEDGRIRCEIEWDNMVYSGRVDKYNGSDLRIVDDSGIVILTTKDLKSHPEKIKYLRLYDEGIEIEDPFIGD